MSVLNVAINQFKFEKIFFLIYNKCSYSEIASINILFSKVKIGINSNLIFLFLKLA